MQTLSIKLLDETLEKIREIAEKYSWTESEAVRFLIFYGIASVEVSDLLYREQDRTPEEKIDRLTRELVTSRGAYAALKFQNYSLTRDNQVLEFHTSGLRSENRNLKKLVAELRAEIAELKGRPGTQGGGTVS